MRNIITVLVLTLVACGPEKVDNPNFDAGGGTGGNSGTGGSSGTGDDAAVDSGLDGSMDAAVDSGSDAAVDSGMDATLPLPCGVSCTGSTPHCDTVSMTCVACLETIHCGDEVCDLATHTCVNCTASEGCDVDAVCDVANRTCVECVGGLGCDSPQVCADDGNTCVACNMDVDCNSASLVCLAGGHSCVECNMTDDCDNTEQCKPSTNTCVECLADSDCTSPGAAKCNLTTNTCIPCDNNTQCSGVMDGAVALGVCSSGTCVECTATDYDQCGTGNLGQPRVCNVTTRRCGGSTQTEGSAGLCQSCVASTQCEAGQSCVEQTFEGETVGTFCFWRISATQGPSGDCLNVPPYARGLANETSVEGTTVNVCGLRNTTCPGLNHFSNPAIACAPSGVPNHDLCGFSYAGEGTIGNDRDAYCEQVPSSPSYLCTVPCGSDLDCRTGFPCLTQQSPSVCSL